MKMQDAELLREYVRNGSETAFAELVKRYVDLVYCSARRQLGDAQLAEEVAQNVFACWRAKPGPSEANRCSSAGCIGPHASSRRGLSAPSGDDADANRRPSK
jgi:hypothetical protein